MKAEKEEIQLYVQWMSEHLFCLPLYLLLLSILAGVTRGIESPYLVLYLQVKHYVPERVSSDSFIPTSKAPSTRKGC